MPSGMFSQRQAVADRRRRVGAALHLVARLQARREPGCSASRRRRSATGRSGHCGSDRTGSTVTRAGTPSLLRRKSISRYMPLVAAAAMPGRDPALVVAAAGAAAWARSSVFSGLAPLVSSAKSLTVAPRRPGVVGLYRRMPMAVDLSARLSVAALSRQLRRRPAIRRSRCDSPGAA